MSKEVVKKEAAAMTIPDAFRVAKKPSTIDRSDILIPRLLAMQGLSKLVAAEQAQFGDIVNSVTSEVLTTKGKGLSFVPLVHFKTMSRYKLGKNLEFISTEAWNPIKHRDLEWEEVIDGVKYKNVQCLNFYVFLQKDLENPAAFPFMLSFRGASYRNGKKLINHFAQMEMMGVAPWYGVLELSTLKQQNDLGTFYVLDVKPVGQVDVKHAEKLSSWSDVLSQGSHTVHEDVSDDVAPPEKVASGKVEATAQF